MTDQHPITPSPELVMQLKKEAPPFEGVHEREQYLINAAYQAGADEELQGCINFVYDNMLCDTNFYKNLRDARRPKLPSLKEQALAVLEEEPEAISAKELIVFDTDQVNLIRRALEALPE
jgi:hypothetical protein